MWWLIGVYVVAHWCICGGSLVYMWWLIGVYVVAHWWKCDGSLADLQTAETLDAGSTRGKLGPESQCTVL